MTTIAPFVISLVATVLALFAATVSYLVYRTQADPEVIVYVAPDDRRQMIMVLVIENIGRAPARDVTFQLSEPIPDEAYGGEKELPEHMASGPLVHGIPFLPPGGKRVLTWGTYQGLRGAMGGRTVSVTARYLSHHIGRPGRIRHETTCPLEVRSFLGTDASEKNYLKRISDSVDKLAKATEKMANKRG